MKTVFLKSYNDKKSFKIFESFGAEARVIEDLERTDETIKSLVQNNYKTIVMTSEVAGLKNIVVLKNLPSNIIDEAFVILKSNTKIKSLERVDKNNHIQEEQRKEDDYIVREAEMVISNYISRIEKPREERNHKTKQIELKYKRLKLITIILSFVVLVNAIISIIA